MGVKRKFKSKSARTRKPFRANTKRRLPSLKKLNSRLNQISRTIETKSGSQRIDDGTEYLHNNSYILSSTFLSTINGTMDLENSQGNRIGDKITLTGVSFNLMLELNERYSEVTYRLMVIKSSKNDGPNPDRLWQGNSCNKMLDSINTERYTVLAQKYVTIKAGNTGINPSGIQTVGSGFATGTETISRTSRIVKMYVPGRKFTRNGILQYENGTPQTKFFDYHFVLYAYSNFSTVDSGPTAFNVGRLNDCFIKMHYKDA